MNKRNLARLLILSGVCCLASCDQGSISSDSEEGEFTQISEFDEIRLTNNVELDYDHCVFDDFTGGVSQDNWYISNSAWGKGNGGVVPQNVFYTDDGKLVLRSNGEYYGKGEVVGVGEKKDGRCTGGVLISKFLCTPGRFESRFIPVPRQGACTCMWTYAYKAEGTEALNHEIDIELPGGSSTGTITFEKCLFTNWHTEQKKQSQDVLMETATHGKTINLNDGQYHTFGFDWYTDPEMIVYYVDGYVTAINTGFVPDLQTRLWLGNWFPAPGSFVGTGNFETEYMVVDWFKYIPFKQQPYTPYEPNPGSVATSGQYPTSPISMPKADRIANGDFEYYLKTGASAGYGWKLTHLGKKPKSGEKTDACLVVGDGKLDTVGARIDSNALLTTTIDSIYKGYKYDFSFDYKSEKSDSLVCYISYLDVIGGSVKRDTYVCDGATDFVNKKISLEAPEGCASVRIDFCNDKDTELTNRAVIDNVSMERK